jgi:ribose transport system permease protein
MNSSLPDPTPPPRLARRMLERLGENGFVVIFLLWCLFLAFATDRFLTWQNIFTVLRQSSIISILALGEMLVLVTGAMDVSLAAVLGCAGVVTAGLMMAQVPPGLACLIGLGSGGAIGLINGLIVTKIRINPIIATLGMLSILNGLAFVYTQGQTLYGESLSSIAFVARGYIGPLPLPVLSMFAIYSVFAFILNRMLFGAQLYAVGSNERAAWLSGIHVDRVRLAAFVVAGLLAGCAGVMQVSRQGSATAGMGDEFLFPMLTAVVLGGVSVSGGKGRVWNVLIASIFLVTITNGLVLLGTSEYVQRIVSGLILIAALSLDRLRARLR